VRAVRGGPSLGRHSDYLGALRLNNGCSAQHEETDIARPAAGLLRPKPKNCCGKIAAWNARDAGRYSSAKGWRRSSALWAFRSASVSSIVATTACASVGSGAIGTKTLNTFLLVDDLYLDLTYGYVNFSQALGDGRHGLEPPSMHALLENQLMQKRAAPKPSRLRLAPGSAERGPQTEAPSAGGYLPAASVARENRNRTGPVHPRSGGDKQVGETSGRAERPLTGLKETGAGEWLPPPHACDCGRQAFLWPCASACGWSLHPVAGPWRWL
jgi:hypothetical protein